MGFIFLLLQHFYTTTAADLWLSTYLTGLTVERYLSVACHQWHNKHVTQRKLTCVAIAVAASFCCCVAISDFILTETPNQSGKVKELVTSLIISLCSLLVLITQCAVCCHVRAFRKTHSHPTGLKVIVYTIKCCSSKKLRTKKISSHTESSSDILLLKCSVKRQMRRLLG